MIYHSNKNLSKLNQKEGYKVRGGKKCLELINKFYIYIKALIIGINQYKKKNKGTFIYTKQNPIITLIKKDSNETW